MSDSIQLGSEEVPEVLPTLAALLPQFEGEQLEAQLQTFDTFLGILSPVTRPKIAALIRDAAAKATSDPVRARIAAAATSVEQGGRAAEPYDHAKAMAEYKQSFGESHPDAPIPSNVDTVANPAPAGEIRPHPRILAQLDKIEAELKKIGRWSEHPPADFVAKVERGELRSFLEAPTFELWLQVVLLPRARQAALEDELPDNSQVGEMARRQYDYMSIDYDAERLLKLLQEFDQLVIKSHRGKA